MVKGGGSLLWASRPFKPIYCVWREEGKAGPRAHSKQGWGCWVGPGLYGSRRRGALSPEGSGGQDCGNEAPGLQCLLHHLPIELCFTKHKLRDKITSGLWVQALNPNAGILLRLGLYTTVVISPFNHLLVCKIHSDISDFLILKTSTL